MRVRHPKGTEDVARGPFSEALAGHARDGFCQKGKTRVAVKVLFSGGEVQFLLSGDHLEDLVSSDHVVQSPAGDGQQLPLISQTADVVNHLTKRDLLSKVRELR